MPETRRFSTERTYPSSVNGNGSQPQQPNNDIPFGDPNIWYDNALLPYNVPDAISMALMPGLYQWAEFSQQMYMQQYLNWYNSESQRMQRGIDAGINPYLMANGIAGSSNPSASAPPSAVGAGSQSLSAIANGLGTLGSLASQGINSFAQMFKLRHEVRNLDADSSLKFEQMGFTAAQSKAMAIQLRYMDEKEQVSVWQALANLDKTKQEYSNLQALHKNIIAQYDEIIAHKDLLISQEGEVQALKKVHEAEVKRLEAVTQWQQIDINFFTSHGYKLGSPIYEGLRDSVVSGHDFDPMAFGTLIGEYQGNLDSIYFNAQASASWNTRPSNATEMAAWVGGSIGKNLRDIVLKASNSTSLLNALSKVGNKGELAEFNDAYDDAKSELYNNYRKYRYEYRKMRYSGISDAEVAKIYQRMISAKKEYDEFSKEKFSDSLIKSISPR